MAAARVPVKSRPTRAKADPEPRVHILKEGTLESVAEFINEGKAKNIIVMSGAGISTAAGIQDFRSPGTGLYDDLERFNLPYPEAVFDISFFKNNPSPFYRLAKELLPGRYRPTLTHYLLPLLAKKGLLLRSYTQNIDMLERLTGLDPELLVEAHGSFATSKCIECDVLNDSTWVRKHILKGEIPHCAHCGGLVKPTITFFGEELPPRFGSLALADFKKCDLLIVLGTSLQVEPFNRLITRVSPSCPRLLINRERAGEDMHSGFDFDDKWKYTIKRDALFLGSCDEGTRKLAKLCGWEGELQAMFEAGNIEMQLAEELEALTLAKELEEEQKEIEKEEKEEAEAEVCGEGIEKNADSGPGLTGDELAALDEITERLQATGLSSSVAAPKVVVKEEMAVIAVASKPETGSTATEKPKVANGTFKESELELEQDQKATTAAGAKNNVMSDPSVKGKKSD
ncbi:NAD-dependent protein deacetylase sirtuin-2 [Mortierella claussenii]|nr:NAD-dependent protein deacetylase sirtuin-2 [Mortierella claussenii]